VKDMKLFIGTVAVVAFVSVGCPGSSTTTTTTTTTTTPAPTLTPEQTLAMACIVGKTILVTGTYYTSVGAAIDISRQADISADLFKVQEQGGDELARLESEDPEVAKWNGDQFSISSDGTTGVGITERYCYQVSYTRGPFPGPSGNCKIEFTARVCEDCTIEDAEWILTCDLADDGTGTPKAKGTWSVQ